VRETRQHDHLFNHVGAYSPKCSGERHARNASPLSAAKRCDRCQALNPIVQRNSGPLMLRSTSERFRSLLLKYARNASGQTVPELDDCRPAAGPPAEQRYVLLNGERTIVGFLRATEVLNERQLHAELERTLDQGRGISAMRQKAVSELRAWKVCSDTQTQRAGLYSRSTVELTSEGAMKKSEPRDRADELPASPISFHPSSNGEFEPRPVTDRDRHAAAMYRDIVEAKARRLGMTRRAFTESASGMMAALVVLNQVYGCSSGSKSGGSAGAAGGGAGAAGAAGAAGGGGAGSGGAAGFSRDAGFDVPHDVSAMDAAQANADAGYDASMEAVEDAALADPIISGQEFIFDVQTHTTVPAPPWNASTCTNDSPMLCPKAYLSGIFVDSDTSVACLSGYPAPRQNDRPSIQARGRIKEIVDMLGGSPRLVIHANVRPDEGMAELDAMAEDALRFPVAAWKTYPPTRSGNGLDSDEFGPPFVERMRETGVRIVASHRGISDDAGNWNGRSSPQDVVSAAKAAPDIKFLIYHAGWQSDVAEDHPFNMADTAPRGIDRLIKAVVDAGLGPESNVYAELGTTWFSLMNNMSQAAHALGKLLKYLGPDRILWGTDSYNNGGPQPQIAAFRAFQIPQSMQDMYGYPALTPEVKAKIFGLNASAVYGVDPKVMREKIKQDQIDNIMLARRQELHHPRFASGPRVHGPRTRREYLAFLRWSGGV
jgi:uncharacterized protein